MIRQQELIMRLHDTWESRELGNSMVTVMNLKFEDIDAWAKRYPYRTGLSEPVAIEPEAFAIVRVARFFEEVGVLLQKKLIDIEIG